MGLGSVEVLSRTVPEAATAKAVPLNPTGKTHVTTGVFPRLSPFESAECHLGRASHPARPGTDCGDAASVGMEYRQRVGGARFAVNGDKDPAARSQGLENPTIVC